MFDVLTYEKGASVLWMIEQYLGRDRFRDGVRRYLKAHAYANTETTDLWDAIEEVRRRRTRARAHGHLDLPGRIPADHRGGGCGQHDRARQTPFSYLPVDAREVTPAVGSEWLVPILYGPGPDVARTLLTGESIAVSIEGLPIGNAGGSGFFRLHHDDATQATLLDHLDTLSPTERHNLVADTWAVTVAGRGWFDAFLSIVDRLGGENDPHVWSVVIGASGLLDLVAEPSSRPALAGFVERLLDPGARQGGGVDRDVRRGRADPVAALIPRLRARDDRGQHVGDRRGPTALRSGHGGRAGPRSRSRLRRALAVVRGASPRAPSSARDRPASDTANPRSPMDEIRHLNCSAGLPTSAILRSPRRSGSSAAPRSRSQNAPYILGSMLRNRYVGAATFAYIVDHFAELADRFPDNSIHRMLEGVAGLVVLDDHGSPLLLDDVSYVPPQAHVPRRLRMGGSIEQSIERHEVNLRFAVVDPRHPRALGWAR